MPPVPSPTPWTASFLFPIVGDTVALCTLSDVASSLRLVVEFDLQSSGHFPGYLQYECYLIVYVEEMSLGSSNSAVFPSYSSYFVF